MEAQSPPKRMTRARAAAKASTSETGPKTTKIMTAAAKAKAAPAGTRATASSKRKTRSDEEEEADNESPEPAAHLPRARGRPKKKTDDAEETSVSSSAPGRATRARAAARKATADAPKAESAPAEPVKPIRGRPRKTQPQDEAGASAEPLRKTTRARATAATTIPTKHAVKKKVTFEEPEKENVHPGTGKKEGDTNASGLRARPVRKAPIPKTTRTTAKADAGATKEAKKTPLSPKKVTQMPHARDDSEDELTSERTPVKPTMKSPVKPPSSAVASLIKPELPRKEPGPVAEPEPDEAAAAEIVFGSPARRPPASPFKDSMKSPAKRIEGMSLPKPMHSTQKSSGDCVGTPFKTSLLGSPAKRPQSAIKGLNVPVFNRNATEEKKSPAKTSFLQSPAKRSTVPLKGMPTPKIREPAQATDDNFLGAQVSATTTRSPITSPVLLATLPALPSMTKSSDKLLIDEQEGPMDHMVGELAIKEPEALDFPGRLSAVLPRHADPSLKDNLAILHETKTTDEAPTENSENVAQRVVAETEHTLIADEMPTDNDHMGMMDHQLEPQEETEEPANPTLHNTPSPSTKKQQPLGIFGLREKDMDPYRDLDWEDSEDELASSVQRGGQSGANLHEAVPATPTPATSSRQPASSRTPKLGFTPLAKKFCAWSATSPVKAAEPSAQEQGTKVQDFAEPGEASPTATAFFDDEMSVRAETEITGVVDENDSMVDVDEPEFDDVLVTDEDVELAAEADEMSLIEPQPEEDDLPHDGHDVDDGLSEASQEYADENEMPLDPALSQQGLVVPPKTPLRVISREFHTTSKVPLKGADESTPRPKKKRRPASISRLPVSRPTHGLTRSATVISYSPMKNNHDQDDSMGQEGFAEHEPQQSAPTTPTKSETWSSVETPARTPRRDLNVTLLSGAVVFVDVHTSEGADASGIFVELLTQMGARCVKNWTWNPDGSTGSDSSRIGITHVVYKDGGKRTMEKVRESGGVVQCVGVSWVLDCERSNEWLDEAPYYIDTSLVPRGGSRRRKSMEPRALANMNGNLVSTPAKGGRDALTAPNTPMNRRDSTAWMRTPSDQAEDDDQDWQALLTPVPKTPAPEALARYAADVTPETPTAAFNFGDDESPSKNAALMQTCPPKPNAFSELGYGILDREKDEGVLQRLMAARRKSLQFAPKIGSPLSRAWK